MRAIVLLAFLLGLSVVSLLYPVAGLFTWMWLTVMQPHQEVWGLGGARLVLIIAAITLFSWVISSEKKTPPLRAPVIVLGLFLVWLLVSQVFSLDKAYSFTHVDRFVRTIVLLLLCACLIDSKVRVHAMIWIFCISLGYYGVKGGLFTVLSGGSYRTWGPANTAISDNNHLGAAIAFLLPLLNYLRLQSEDRTLRYGILAAMLLCVFCVLGSHSRTALIALGGGCMLLWWRSSARLVTLGVLLPVLAVGVMFMPEHWHDRMSTISSYEEDGSFMGRVDAWVIATEVAMHRPLTGGGLRVFYNQEIADRFLDEFREARAAHSIYFEILGGMGFVGLALMLLMILLAVRDSMWIRTYARGREEHKWAWDFASMAQVSIVVYLIAGLALSLEQWIGSWLLFLLLAQVRCRLEMPELFQRSAAMKKAEAEGGRGGGRYGSPLPGSRKA